MSAEKDTPLERNPMLSGGGADCGEVLAEVWMFLDRECDQNRRQLLQQHLDECAPCLAEYGIDEKLKALLARKCGGEAAPESLKDRLRTQIRSAVLEQAQVTVESGPEGTSVSVARRRTEYRSEG
ncbi:anti-sigma factor [Pseudonocardia sp. Ae168_Ps1]|uniref:mycothiol system anti-sigma-R factor n=2 Tax=unclassified Pseudonocardia TaxID=2619320 RepID=UPI0001FFEAC5|nr:anti-sigma factor [Pseudonocardia sp. Ae150A_Ps1]OLL79877.1 anti-sigma factor [Pseudonocardia sp. Ae168_Ps1]OLL85990.1 anti-sigma factor [Pseudonocardia sp. Ae263_Ps1]OLL93980.1 anti-sigma factor [Pseudonocardia sp. Ae356_Ps1]OLM20499.1 anti-sigma factor [Pseudonocardia sp. Ae707_Ps1]